MTNPVDELAGDDLLRAVAEVEGVDPSELEPWGVFKRVLELVHLRETDFRAAMRLPPHVQLFPPGWYVSHGPDPLTAVLRVYLKVQYISRQTHDNLSQSLGP